MVTPVSSPKPGENTWLWLAKIITGVLIIVILVIHFIVNHFIAEGGLLTYAGVVRYYQNPIIPIMEAAFVIFVVSHALIGLRSIILDLRPSKAVLSLINWGFTLVGVVSIGYGIWLIGTIVAQGS